MQTIPAVTAADSQRHPLLFANALEVEYRTARAQVRALNGVTFELGKAEILGLVGESGSGKSTLGMVVAGFLAATGGSLTFEGTTTNDWRRHSGSGRDGVQMIFQDSATALNPRKTIDVSVAEAIAAGAAIRPEHKDRAVEYLEQVGLGPQFARRKPRELSGGQRQRVAIARALAARPRVLVCDESVSALDVSARAQVLNLLVRIRNQEGIAMLFISHDLAVVSQLVDRVLVMHKGEVCEQGPTDQVINRPENPYTQRLLAAIPRLERSPASVHVAGDRATHSEGALR
jgi:ABC-type glutathione transport system ATPase component